MCGRPEPEQFPFNIRIAVAIDLTPIEPPAQTCGRRNAQSVQPAPDPLAALANPQTLAALANMAALMFRE